MKNWVIQGLILDFNPSLYNYLKFKLYHFNFCRKDDPTITASLYINNLLGQVDHELAQQKQINKKSLILAVVKKLIDNQEGRKELIALFAKQPPPVKEEIRSFLHQISLLVPDSQEEKEKIINEEERLTTVDFPIRTYVIATHMYLEINNNELHYETLIRDTTALKEFISAKFKLSRIPGRIEEMKSFSYKKILHSKSAVSAKGQLLPQIRQIALNPEIFGTDVSAFAESILKLHSPSKK